MAKSDSIVASGVDAARARRPAFLDRFARGAVLSRLAGIKSGRLVIEDGGERIPFGQDLSDADLRATIRVHDRRFYSDLARRAAWAPARRTWPARGRPTI